VRAFLFNIKDSSDDGFVLVLVVCVHEPNAAHQPLNSNIISQVKPL